MLWRGNACSLLREERSIRAALTVRKQLWCGTRSQPKEENSEFEVAAQMSGVPGSHEASRRGRDGMWSTATRGGGRGETIRHDGVELAQGDH